MGTERVWVYRVEEPHGSQGWHPHGSHSHRSRGVVTTDAPGQDAKYVATLVVTDLITEWKANGIGQQHVRVIVWAHEEGTGPKDAVFTVEIQPGADGERPIATGFAHRKDTRPGASDRWIKGYADGPLVAEGDGATFRGFGRRGAENFRRGRPADLTDGTRDRVAPPVRVHPRSSTSGETVVVVVTAT
ncbi:hypothetical protein [Streptomyces sp. CA-106110]|uniref:hypothetical protein n=1 Tax=Streptomyces sp. CA-106110 TaxID=3240044 RepID=UPI003D8FA887